MAGMNALPRAQLAALSSVVVSMLSSTYFSSSAPSSSPLSIWRAVSWRARNSPCSPAAELLAGYLHSSAPLRQT